MEEYYRPKASRCKATPTQLSYLAEFMKNHRDMFTGIGHSLQQKVALEKTWEKLAAELNALGGPIKTATKWKQAWRDMRNNLKKKAALNRAEHQDYEPGSTVDGPPLELKEADEQVFSMVRPVAVYGLQDVATTETSNNAQEVIDSDSGSEEYLVSRTHTKEEKETKDPLLETVDGLKNIPSQHFCKAKLKKGSSKRFHNAKRAKLRKVSEHQLSKGNNDEFDLFGLTIAEQLRQLPLKIALETEEIILSAIRRQRIRVSSNQTL